MPKKTSDLYLLSDSIFSWQIESFSHHQRRTCCFVFFFLQYKAVSFSHNFIIYKDKGKKHTSMLEVEITQQRSIHTTKWEIILGKSHKQNNKSSFSISSRYVTVPSDQTIETEWRTNQISGVSLQWQGKRNSREKQMRDNRDVLFL